MFSRLHLQLVAAVLIVTGIVAFAPRLQPPHMRLSCRSYEGTTLSGAQRFTKASSSLPDLKVGYEAHRASFPKYLKRICDGQAARPLLSFRFAPPSAEPFIRRFKLLPSRAESQDPL